ncbi:MAG: sugar phosphate isomerase/epimerase family protein [bacterium]
MQISMCHYSLHRTWERERWSIAKLVDYVASLGVPGIDFHTRLIPPETSGEELRRAVSDAGLALTGVSFSNNFNLPDAGERAEQVERVRGWIHLAADAGAPVSRIFGGHLSDRTDDRARSEGRKLILDSLALVARTAEEHGVVLALENHGGLPCTAEEQIGVIESIGSPNLRATIDVGNYMQCGQEGHEATRVAAGYAAYVHFKDFRKVDDTASPWGWSIEPCTVGDGDVDHAACIRAMRDAGYEGSVAIEYEGTEDELTGVPRSVEYTRRILD